MENKVTLQDLQKAIETIKEPRSAWGKGVKRYALFLIENRSDLDQNAPIETSRQLSELLLCGAANWGQFSWGGSALIYDTDIAKTLCTPSELRKTHNGTKRPNSREEWLDTQARALFQADILIQHIYIFLRADTKPKNLLLSKRWL